jgi:hypothetical protein
MMLFSLVQRDNTSCRSFQLKSIKFELIEDIVRYAAAASKCHMYTIIFLKTDGFVKTKALSLNSKEQLLNRS